MPNYEEPHEIDVFNLSEASARRFPPTEIGFFPNECHPPRRPPSYRQAIRKYYRGKQTRWVLAKTRVVFALIPEIATFVVKLACPPPPDRMVFAVVEVEYCGRPVWHERYASWREFDSLDAALNSLDAATREGLIFLTS
jgi:hypothetical protein